MARKAPRNDLHLTHAFDTEKQEWVKMPDGWAYAGPDPKDPAVHLWKNEVTGSLSLLQIEQRCDGYYISLLSSSGGQPNYAGPNSKAGSRIGPFGDWWKACEAVVIIASRRDSR